MTRYWASAVVCLLGATLVAGVTAAPAPVAKPDKWEYAELYYRSISFGGRGEDFPPPGGGNRGGRGRGGPAVPGQADQPPRPARPRVTVRWITADGELEASTWEDLAAKLKVPPGKADASSAAQKVRLLNHLGSQGWELIAVGSSTTAPWVFKRKTK